MEDRLRYGRGQAIGTPAATPAAGRAAFIRANTALLPVPLVPELRLHLASEALELWQKTEEELGAMGLPPPYWAFAWAGGQALARYLLDRPGTVAGARVLDLGAGSGLTGIAAARAGAAEVTASEIDAYAVAAITLNAAANGVALAPREADMLDDPAEAWDVVLVGDMFYEKPLAGRALAFLDRCRERGARVLVGDPGRSYLPRARLLRLARYSVPVSRDLEDMEIKDTAVWRLRAEAATAMEELQSAPKSP